MTNSSLHSDNVFSYRSFVALKSDTTPGVSYTVLRMSFGRRMELFRLIREMAAKLPYLDASTELQEKVEANLLSQAIDELYLRWGLLEVRGLSIDGESATVESLIACGPEELTKEIVAAVKAQCGLSEEERKN
jgi:hypothetical protein